MVLRMCHTISTIRPVYLSVLNVTVWTIRTSRLPITGTSLVNDPFFTATCCTSFSLGVVLLLSCTFQWGSITELLAGLISRSACLESASSLPYKSHQSCAVNHFILHRSTTARSYTLLVSRRPRSISPRRTGLRFSDPFLTGNKTISSSSGILDFWD